MEYIYKTYHFKLRLTNNQEARINGWINTCRAVYNLALETKTYSYDAHRVRISSYELIKQLPELRKEFDWIKDVPSQSLQNVIERLDESYKSFYSGKGFPGYAKKHQYRSIIFKSAKKDTHNRIILPKIGSVKYFNSRLIKGELRTAIIIKENGNYFISILTKQERETINPVHDSQVGIDMGVAFFASLSTGEQIANPRHFLKYQKQLRIENRSLSRKVKGSNNWHKQRCKLSKLHAKIRNVRKDFVHKQSSHVVDEFGFIALEDLQVSNMVKFGPLSKHILDASWAMFFKQLVYKSDWYGNILIKVDAKYTSQTCNHCGAIDKLSRVSQSGFVCTSCGVEDNADINAAKNILGRALSNLHEREALACA